MKEQNVHLNLVAAFMAPVVAGGVVEAAWVMRPTIARLPHLNLSAPPPVSEPTTWAMMALGMSLIAGGLYIRRSVSQRPLQDAYLF